MIRHTADRVRALLALLGPVSAGSRVLLLRLIGRFGWKGAVVGAALTVYAAARYRTWIAWMLIAWCAAALAHAPKNTETDDEPDEEEQAANDPQEVYVATLEWIRGQVADNNGIHLSELLAHAHAHNMHTDLDVPAFRAVLEKWGFPIRQQLKVGGRNRPGIHRDDLPKSPAPAPSPLTDSETTTSAEYQP